VRKRSEEIGTEKVSFCYILSENKVWHERAFTTSSEPDLHLLAVEGKPKEFSHMFWFQIALLMIDYKPQRS
jgi:hypothetical protein